MSSVQEAVVKTGSALALEQAVQGGRVLRRMANGMQLFYFPSRDYMREVSFTQGVQGFNVKHGGNEDDFNKAAEDQLGYDWEPSAVVGSMEPTMSMDKMLGGGPLSAGSSSMFAGGSTPLMAGNSPMLAGGSTPLMAGSPSPMLAGSSTPLLARSPSTMLAGGSTPMLAPTLGLEGGLTDEQKKGLSTCMHEMGKSLSVSMKVIGAGQVGIDEG